MLQIPCKTMGYKKKYGLLNPPWGEVNHNQPVAYKMIKYLMSGASFSLHAYCVEYGNIILTLKGLDKHIFERKIVNIFLPISFSICFGARKNRHIETVLLSTHIVCFG